MDNAKRILIYGTILSLLLVMGNQDYKVPEEITPAPEVIIEAEVPAALKLSRAKIKTNGMTFIRSSELETRIVFELIGGCSEEELTALAKEIKSYWRDGRLIRLVILDQNDNERIEKIVDF